MTSLAASASMVELVKQNQRTFEEDRCRILNWLRRFNVVSP